VGNIVSAACYNFAFTPHVHDNDAWVDMKEKWLHSSDFRIPRDSHAEKYGAGIIIAGLSGLVALR
jgi:hypothetical protein